MTHKAIPIISVVDRELELSPEVVFPFPLSSLVEPPGFGESFGLLLGQPSLRLASVLTINYKVISMIKPSRY